MKTKFFLVRIRKPAGSLGCEVRLAGIMAESEAEAFTFCRLHFGPDAKIDLLGRNEHRAGDLRILFDVHPGAVAACA